MLAAGAFAESIDVDAFRADLRQLTQFPARVTGSDGYYKSADWIESECRKLPGVEFRRQEFPVLVPVTKSATISFDDGRVVPVHPFWPAQARVNSTPVEGIRGKLVYCGECRLGQIPPRDIQGQIAVIEASAGEAWTRAVEAGARAVIVLGSDDTNNFDLRSHDLLIPLNVPRFYIADSKVAEEFRHAQIKREVTLRASVTWETKTAINLFALVKGKSQNSAIMISAPFDSSGLVPDVAVGASQAVQTASALALLRGAARDPPSRPLVFFFSGGDGVQFRATRQMLMALAEPSPIPQRINLYHWLASATGQPLDPEETDSAHRPIELVIGLDLSDRGTRVGPMFFGEFQKTTSINDVDDYLSWLTRASREQKWFEPVKNIVDVETPMQRRSPASYLCAPLPIPTELTTAWGVPGFSFITLDDQRLRRDTPTDTLDHLDIDAIIPQLRAVQEIIRHAADDPVFKGPRDRRKRRADITGQVVGFAPGRPVPNVPRPGFLVAYNYVSTGVSPWPKLRNVRYTLGIRRTEMVACDEQGSYRIEGLPRLHDDLQLFAVTAYRIDPATGAIVATSDLGRQKGDISIYADVKSDPPPLRSLAFDCQEFSLVGLSDPRFLQNLNEVTLLDARRDAEPQRWSLFLHERMMCGFVEPASRVTLVLRFGRVGNRLLLRNVSDFDTTHPLSLVTARDFWQLDDDRLNRYRKASVSSKLIDSMHDETATKLASADRALASNDGEAFTRDTGAAWANEVRVYDATQSLGADVVRGAIFLLLLCVPFAFCMERLLIATPNVYRQITGASAIFLIMAATLWSFHPAFRISSSPALIILAFAILTMSSMVIAVIYSRFDIELKKLRGSGRGIGDEISTGGASLARAGAIASAVLLGIANMRRRKFRTALTSVSIVLITFAILCFTGVSTYLDTSSAATGATSPYRGVMVRQRGFRPIPADAVDAVRATIGLDAPLAQRWWNVSAVDPKDQIAISNGDRVVPVQAMLGLSELEGDVIHLSSETASRLGVRAGDRVRVGGIDLRVARIYSDAPAVALSGESIAPLHYAVGQLDIGGRKMEDVNAAESLEPRAGDISAEDTTAIYEHLSPSQFAIVPMQISRLLPNASLRMLELRLGDDASVKRVSDLVARRFALATFAGLEDGVRVVTAGNVRQVSGAGAVAVPIGIASLIIFNTMLGSIAQRRGEIHIYASLGLAPLHVGILFIAEAVAYGLIGTVFGYVMGQGVGAAMLKLGWIDPGITLNYSGTSAALTMGLILLVVLLSALVPARLASKLAAPNIQRNWDVPKPTNGTIAATLPFTINKTAADGALAYLAEFFSLHGEGAVGKFSAGAVRSFQRDGARGLEAEIWLTPFDLGIRQRLSLSIQPGDYPDIYEVDVILKRESGDDRSWWRANRPFLTELRKQFLAWRTLSPARVAEYVATSRTIFEPPMNTLKK